jgi:parvulin-like peptidyl-prolyl isomerase
MRNVLCERRFRGKRAIREIAACAAAFVLAGGIVFPVAGRAEPRGKVEATQAQQARPAAGDSAGERAGTGRNDAVAARVNGVDIPLSSVTAAMHRLAAKKGHEDRPPAGMEEIRKAALDRLIIQELAFQQAMAQGIKVDEKKIDDAVADLKTKLGGDEAYRKALEREGLSEKELRARLERNVALQMISKKEVDDRISVTDDEVKKEYERDKAAFYQPEKVSVTDVVFFMTVEDRNSEKKAGEILQKIKDDKETNPWHLAPDGTFIVRDTDLDRDKDKELYGAARKLKVGELSGVIVTPDSLHIIKLKEFVPEKNVSFDQAKGLIRGMLRSRAWQKRMEEWQSELKKGAQIEIFGTGKESGG